MALAVQLILVLATIYIMVVRKNKDFTSDRVTATLLWGIPHVVFLIGIFTNPMLRTILWSSALSAAGIACIINAFRCGRIHCYFTGPFYLLMAVLSLLYGIGILQFGQFGWYWIGGAVILLGPILARVPERIYGKYVKSS